MHLEIFAAVAAHTVMQTPVWNKYNASLNHYGFASDVPVMHY